MNKASVFGGSGDHREALLCSRRARKPGGQSKLQQGWFNKGIALSALGKNEDAVSCFTQAHKLNPQDDTALYCWGLALSRTGRTKEALQAYAQCLKVNPRRGSMVQLGRLVAHVWKRRIARLLRKGGTQLKPDYAAAWFNKSYTLGILRRWQAAIEAVNQAICLTPSDADAWCMKGAWLEELHRYDEAIKSFKKGEQLGQVEARQGIMNCQRKMRQ